MKNDRSSERPGEPQAQGDASALFSLAELKSRAAASAATKPREDNSGVIDLRALMAQAEREETAKKAEEQALRVSQHIGVYLFGSPGSTPPPVVTAQPAELNGGTGSINQAGSSDAAGSAPSRSTSRSSRRGRAWVGALSGVLIAGAAMAAAALSGGSLINENVGTARPALAGASEAVASASSSLAKASLASLASSQGAIRVEDIPEAGQPDDLRDRPPKVGSHVAKAPVMNRTPEASKRAPAGAPNPTASPAPTDPCHGDLLCAMQRAIKNQKK